MHLGRLAASLASYPLVASSILSVSCDNQKWLQTLPNVPGGTKITGPSSPGLEPVACRDHRILSEKSQSESLWNFNLLLEDRGQGKT